MTRGEAKEFIAQSVKSDVDMALVADAIKALEQEPTTKTCRTCRNFGTHHGVCEICKDNKCWTEIEPTTKNDLGVDCISRQATINAVKRIHPVDTDYDCTLYDKVDVMYVLDEMPSVIPQEPRWIPVSERLPEDLEPVNITWANHEPEPYYHDIKNKNFVATGIHYRGQWYWYSTTCADYLGEYGSNDIDKVDDAVEIVAWMPLPKPYEP